MGRSAVVFVHGVLSSGDTWRGMHDLLHADAEVTAAFEVFNFSYASPPVVLNPARRIPDIDTLAGEFGTFLQTRVADYDSVVLVSHSQGGLIVQRHLAWMLGEGRGAELARIRRVVMFACPNSGSEFALSLRRTLLWGQLRHPQERQLRPMTASVVAAQRTVLNRIVHAREVTATSCPIRFAVYAGSSDNIVPPESAMALFPHVGVLPGGHSEVIRADSPTHPAYLALKRELMETAKVGAGTAGAAAGELTGARPGVSPPRQPAAGAREIPAERRRRILEALLAVDEVNDSQLRQQLVLMLPPHVRGAVRDGVNARSHLLAILRACERFGGFGREALVEALLLVLPAESPDVVDALAVIEEVWPADDPPDASPTGRA